MNYADLNAKYGAFTVVRYSRVQARYIPVGKIHRTVELALKACKRMERNNPTGWYSLDIAVAA